MEQNTTQTTNDWLEEEANNIKPKSDYEKLPSMIFEEGKIKEFEIDFSKPFEKWQTSNGRGGGTVTKAIIPVIDLKENNIKKNLWLNTSNPLYAQLIHKGREGHKVFKVIQIGKLKDTKYQLVE